MVKKFYDLFWNLGGAALDRAYLLTKPTPKKKKKPAKKKPKNKKK